MSIFLSVFLAFICGIAVPFLNRAILGATRRLLRSQSSLSERGGMHAIATGLIYMVAFVIAAIPVIFVSSKTPGGGALIAISFMGGLGFGRVLTREI
jgi:hypothetical protein